MPRLGAYQALTRCTRADKCRPCALLSVPSSLVHVVRAGWPSNAVENSQTFEEVEPALVSVKRYMRDTRPRSTGWENIQDRTVTHQAKNDGSVPRASAVAPF